MRIRQCGSNILRILSALRKKGESKTIPMFSQPQRRDDLEWSGGIAPRNLNLVTGWN